MSTFRGGMTGQLTITVHGGRNLTSRTLIGKMDPYVVITVGEGTEKFKTKPHKNGDLTPVWEYGCVVNLKGNEDLLHIKAFNQETLSDDVIGRVDFPLSDLDLSGQKTWINIRDPDNHKKSAGEISMTCKFDGKGLPEGSKAFSTHHARMSGGNPSASPVAAVTSPPVVSPNVAKVVSPVNQQQQQPQQQQQQYHPQQYPQAAPQQYQQAPPQYPQQQYQQQQSPPQYQQQGAPQYAPVGYAQAAPYGHPQPFPGAPQQVQFVQAPVGYAPQQMQYVQQQPQFVQQQQPGQPMGFRPAQIVYQQPPPQAQIVYTQQPTNYGYPGAR